MKNVEDRIRAAEATLTKKQAVLDDKEKTASKKEGFDREKWAEGAGKPFQQAVDTSVKQLDELQKELEEINSEWDPQRKEALNALKMSEDTPGYSKCQVGANIEVVPNYLVSKRDGKPWAREVSLGKAGQPLTINLSSSSASYKKSENKMGVKAGLKVFFINIFNAEGKAEQLNLDEASASTKISITFKALTTVLVKPHEGWYKSGYLKKIADDNRWKEPSQSKQTMVGKEGKLHSIICGFVVAYQPTLRIEMAESSFKKMQRAMEGSAGISVPPFSFGGVPGISASASTSGEHSKTEWNKRQEKNVMIIENTGYTQEKRAYMQLFQWQILGF